MTQLQDHFKQAMSRFATGVCVITYKNPENGTTDGITVSAFSSLSLDPVKILFCLGTGGHNHKSFQDINEFSVNILSAEQKDLAYQFAGKDRSGLDAHLVDLDGIPSLNNTLATLICDKGNSYAEGDHDIIIGNVRHIAVNDAALEPMLYYKAKIIEDYQHVE